MTHRALTALEAHEKDDNTIITISGVVGQARSPLSHVLTFTCTRSRIAFNSSAQVSEETKIVNGRARVLTTVHLVDATGRFDVRSWNHTAAQFQSLVDKPAKFLRVRVVSFAGVKLAEFLDGQGSVVESSFLESDALLNWWNSSNF